MHFHWVFLFFETMFVTQSLSHKTVFMWYWYANYISYCAIKSEWIWLLWIGILKIFFQKSIWKQLRPVTMLKKRLLLRCFLASFVNFYITTAFETYYSSNFWMTASRSFIIELIETKFFLLQLFESDENHVVHSVELRSRGKQLYWKETYEFWMQFHCIIPFEATNKKAYINSCNK